MAHPLKTSARTRLAALTLLAPLLAAGAAAPAMAQESFVKAGDFLVRARAIGVLPNEDADISLIGGAIDIENSFMPELDFSYFITDRIAVELIAAVSPHDVAVDDSAIGDVKVGELLLLPPTVTLQYHLPLGERFKPYVGAGLNATFFIDEDAEGTVVTDVDADDSLGFALQAGFDYRLQGPWMLNFDAKRLFLDSDVEINRGAIQADVEIDPWIFGVGVGYRF